MKSISRRTLLAASASALVAGVIPQKVFAAGTYDPGASDKEVRVGQFGPLSGPVSSFGVLANAMDAYFRMVNEGGGINGRKISFIFYDDAYSLRSPLKPPAALSRATKCFSFLARWVPPAISPFRNT